MNFETKRITFSDANSAPYNLVVDTDINLTSESPVPFAWIAIQNVSTRTARFQETEVAPASTATDSGHTLAPGAGVILLLTLGQNFWLWSPTNATVAISQAAPPAELI